MCFPLNSIQIHTHFGHRMNYKIHALKLNGCFCFSLLDPFDTHNTTYMTILFVLFGCSCACCVSCAVRRIYLIGLCTVKKKRKRKQQEQTFGWFFFSFFIMNFSCFFMLHSCEINAHAFAFVYAYKSRDCACNIPRESMDSQCERN